MPSITTLLAAAGLAASAAADIIKITATTDSAFNPNSVTAKAGDVLEFHFQSGNHSVVAGDYHFACSPLPVGYGFFSGYVNVDPGQIGKVFRVSLANEDPLVFYSSHADDCSRGMVGIVNPNEQQNLENYMMRASLLSQDMIPDVVCHGEETYGGQLADEEVAGKCTDTTIKGNITDVTPGSKKNETHKGNEEIAGGKGHVSAVQMLEVPLLAVAVAVASGAMAVFAGL
ncbi:hypothetical protein E4U60_007228 [Claviceps pazoutovae]|uniref:Extracellular serine-rich protein n=1 Tax=Claviceps pazoutovae TaxID=1649127 RepID=A0A9P7MFS5_9HYPO|nr:hypothetical protein E4U60_007228 [Claviceps pazoutovae]